MASSRALRASEYPFECRPLDGSAMATSPSATRAPSTIFRRATTPTAKPARSYSPAAYIPGSSAVSPPRSAQPLSLHAAAIPATTFSATRDVELARGEVVEEEEWPGAAGDDVVHAHAHEVEADRVVHARGEGYLELGADAVGPADEDGILDVGRHAAKARETADAAPTTSAMRVAAASGLMRSTSSSPASMSTPACL